MKNNKLLLLLLLCAIGVYVYKFGTSNPLDSIALVTSENHSNSSAPILKPNAKDLGIDEDAIKIIERLVSDVEVKPEENNLQYAIKLDHEIGRPLWQQRKYRETYETYKKVLKISYNLGSLRGIQIALGALANLRKSLGQHEEGMDVLMLAYKVALKEDDPYEYGVHEIVIAESMEKQDRGMALMWRLKAKEHLQGTPHVQDYVSLLGDIADDLYFFKRKDEAFEIYKEAYELSKKIGSDPNKQWIIKSAQYEYAQQLVQREKCDEAIPLISEHHKTYSTPKDKSEWYYTKMLHMKGLCQAKTGEDGLALNSYMKAYSNYEVLRSLANSDEDRAKTDNNNTDLVNSLVHEYIRSEMYEEALLVLESNKARTLADIIGDQAQKEIYDEWQKLKVQHSQELEKLFSNDDDPMQRVNIQERIVQYFDLQKKYREGQFNLKLSQESKQVLVSEQMTSSTLSKILDEEQNDTVVISLFVGQETIGVFSITKDSIKYYKTDYSPRELALRVKEIQYMIANPFVDYYKVPSEEVYNKVFSEVFKDIGSKYKRLVISNDNYFKSLPFGILYDGKQFLTERYIIQQYPSLRHYYPERESSTKLVANGITCVDPAIEGQRLPFQKETSAAIKKLGGDKVVELIGKNCTSKNIETQLSKLDGEGFLHIGAHGVFLSYEPMESGIMMSSDNMEGGYNFWNAMAMATTNMNNISLLTLSSCDTGVTDKERARDIFGVLRGVFYAGVDNVVAPLWPVEDLPTSYLMQSFYNHYLKLGDPARALTHAQRFMINYGKYKHPFYWGGFISIGGASK